MFVVLLPVLDLDKSVVSNTTVPYIRRIREGVEFVGSNQDILMNSKEEFLQGLYQALESRGALEDEGDEEEEIFVILLVWFFVCC